MAKVCDEICEREDHLKEKLISEGIGSYICCCCCPVLEECKEMDDGNGCDAAKNGTFTKETCLECAYCIEE